MWNSLPAFDDEPLWGEIIKEGESQIVPWLTLSLHYIYIVTLAQNVIGLWEVRESVPLHCWRALGHLTTQKGGLRCVL